MTEGQRLLVHPRRSSPDGLLPNELHNDLHGCIRAGKKIADARLKTLKMHSPPSQQVVSDLKIGLGSPSTTGCLNVAGTTVKLKTLVNSPTSVQSFMEQYGLHAVALPGARLPEHFKTPSGAPFCIYSKGSSYNSTAVAILRSHAGHFQHLASYGSGRRLWLRVAPVHGSSFFWLVYYLHATDDDQWADELRGITQDILLIRARFGEEGNTLFLLTGDANVQPSCIGKGPDRNAFRNDLWISESHLWGLRMRNPTSFGENAVPVCLPIRQVDVYIRPCDSHHCCGADKESRAIDIIEASVELEMSTLLHNGLHCKAGDCEWDMCHEYTLGDHFLFEIQFAKIGVVAPLD